MKSTLLSFLLLFAWVLPVKAQSLCVTKAGALLRAQPQASAAMSWKVPKFMPLQPTGERRGSWVEVTDVDGQKHWVNRRDVSQSLRCLVVTAKRSSLRSGPGSTFEIAAAGVVDRYSAFLDLGGEDGWTQVEDEAGEKAWINLDHTWKPRRTLRLSFEGQ